MATYTKPDYLTDEEYGKCLLLDVHVNKRSDGYYSLWRHFHSGELSVYCDKKFKDIIKLRFPSDLLDAYIRDVGRWLR